MCSGTALRHDPNDITGARTTAALIGRFRHVISVYISGQGDGVVVSFLCMLLYVLTIVHVIAQNSPIELIGFLFLFLLQQPICVVLCALPRQHKAFLSFSHATFGFVTKKYFL